MTAILTPNMEDYLEAIYLILEEKQAVRPKDISKKLGVNNSSVTGALRSLSEKRMINYSPYDVITLTAIGKQSADRIIQKHTVLRRFFVDVLKIDRGEADKTACMMEHVLTDKVYDRLVQLIDHVAKCPYNNANLVYSDITAQDGE